MKEVNDQNILYEQPRQREIIQNLEITINAKIIRDALKEYMSENYCFRRSSFRT